MNVVFDLGGVVFRWDPDAIIRRVFRDPETRHRVKAEVFGHEDWVALDRGTLELSRAVLRCMSRTGLPREDIERLFGEVPGSLTPIPGTFELIRAAKHAGNSLYVLSNMHTPSMTHLEASHDIWHLFDGVVISCRVNRVKPEREIYEHLLEEYRLDASDTVFIDDTKDNLVAASRLGIQTIGFVDASQCREELVRRGCPLR